MSSKVLLIEDNPELRRTIALILRKKDCQVLTVSSGEDGIALARENQDIFLVLSDIDLPGILGYEAIVQLKKILNGHTRYVLMSGRDHDPDKTKVADKLIPKKQITLATLCGLLKDITAKQKTDSP